MRIAVKGRNTPVTDGLQDHVERRFRAIARQVSELAELEVELSEERNPAISDREVAEATLYLKGVTLRARATAPDMHHAIVCCEEQLARQVKRHREQRRKRRATRAAQQSANGLAGGGASAA
ncbi:MAG: ribosome-associated translation inhibitor RaiA [Actinobacteria bacterium]|nr:ribosome-associated translation inhibitor RaiA [Actinomycetota bacterium]